MFLLLEYWHGIANLMILKNLKIIKIDMTKDFNNHFQYNELDNQIEDSNDTNYNIASSSSISSSVISSNYYSSSSNEDSEEDINLININNDDNKDSGDEDGSHETMIVKILKIKLIINQTIININLKIKKMKIKIKKIIIKTKKIYLYLKWIIKKC